ncbi:alpha/beta fold hydrolase [Virgibacillus sediminis]|uniref:Alpha/beta fold hydrolase n=1 Tax=Virgibacillus sediminis TaxID=202260 RepID=A0ABV7A8S1_9BACI
MSITIEGKRATFAGIDTHYYEEGQGEPVLFIHGSGPGVSAWANWRLVLPRLSKNFHVIAPDLAGFGSTEKLEEGAYGMDVWVDQLSALIEDKGLERVSLVGNSLGGAIALHLAKKRPELLDKLVLMGTAGVPFELTEGLDKVWGYTPSYENMAELIDIFSYDDKYKKDKDLIELRYQGTLDKENQDAFASMFPAPRQAQVDKLALSDEELQDIKHPVLALHGREDQVIPAENSWKAFQALPNAEMHLFSKCGHWIQIEKTEEFCQQVEMFLNQE